LRRRGGLAIKARDARDGGIMLDGCARYAVYYAPPKGSALAFAGAAWLGHDPERGAPHARLEVDDLPAPRADLVRRAARYGLHGTLKAPFRLNEGMDVAALDEAITALAAAHAPVAAPGLTVTADLGFVALRPGGPCPALDTLAAACVTGLDLLREPMTATELAEKRRGGLEQREDENLRAWGYPYVLDCFQFHITLTGPLPRADAEQSRRALARALRGALPERFEIGDICLFGDPGGAAPFRLLRRYPLTGGVIAG